MAETKQMNAKTINTRRRTKSQRRWFFFFISPWLIGFLIFTIGPMIYSFAMSFTNWDMFTKMEFVGIDNYTRLSEDRRFLLSVKNTFIYTLISVPVNMLISLAMAYLLSFKLKGMRVFRTMYYLPAVVPGVASCVLFKSILANKGILSDGTLWEA